MTVEDAARYTGRKVIVVFSNGPDNASLVPPEDVAELAQSTGTIIYMISTREAQLEPISTAVFERMSKATGGKAYFARNWNDEKKAFPRCGQQLSPARIGCGRKVAGSDHTRENRRNEKGEMPVRVSQR